MYTIMRPFIVSGTKLSGSAQNTIADALKDKRGRWGTGCFSSNFSILQPIQSSIPRLHHIAHYPWPRAFAKQSFSLFPCRFSPHFFYVLRWRRWREAPEVDASQLIHQSSKPSNRLSRDFRLNPLACHGFIRCSPRTRKRR